MTEVPHKWVGKLNGNPQSRVLPCGHVELLIGAKMGTVEFETAWKYAEELQRQLREAREAARGN